MYCLRLRWLVFRINTCCISVDFREFIYLVKPLLALPDRTITVAYKSCDCKSSN